MLEDHLQKHFNFSSFKPGQKEIVQNIIDKKDVVALMPTGGGKSLCYQLPAIISDKLTIVISPLIALMKDQVDALNARGISAAFINSSLNQDEVQSRLEDIKSGKTKILYIAPERLASGQITNIFSNIDVNFFAIDEAHCVSSWGHDFRPDYLLIKNVIKNFTNRPTVAAFTATATPEVKDDIIENLNLINPQIFVAGFDRPNLKFLVNNGLSADQAMQEALRIIKSNDGSGIIYTITRKKTEEVAEFLQDNGIKAQPYHAGMDSSKRTQIQADFMENKYKVIVATIAFGMGVDKADIRFVLHLGMPSSLENYYQEAGRAGRDSETAYCILMPQKRDFGLHYHFIQKGKQEMEDMGKSFDEINRISSIKYGRLEKMRDYMTDNKCRRKAILEYFNDPNISKYADNCQGCDICLDYKWEGIQSTDEIKKQEIKSKFTETVQQTIDLFENNNSIEQIAKMRNLGQRTIFNHLIQWYLNGGDLEIGNFITKDQERQILIAMSKADDYQRLRPIKDELPDNISYEQIKLVIAKIQRINL